MQFDYAPGSKLHRARELIEALVVVDPTTGESGPAFEPDPARPGRYRKTSLHLWLEAAPDTAHKG